MLEPVGAGILTGEREKEWRGQLCVCVRLFLCSRSCIRAPLIRLRPCIVASMQKCGLARLPPGEEPFCSSV